MNWMFKLRGELSRIQQIALGLSGILLFLFIWLILTSGADPLVKSGILPHPWRVLTAYGDLLQDNELVQNTCYSVGLNLAGYVKAIVLSLFFGFVIGLFPLFRGMLRNHVNAIRFIPLTAVTGLFIVWFGIGTDMKVNFLAFGIMIYLLPVVVQRIDEVSSVYLKTVYTLGASAWETIKTVFLPSVLSRLFDDIRILTAISWTYIIVAEMIASQGGIGALLFSAGRRQGRVDKIFALLVLIVLIGVVQDKIFKNLDKEFFPFKYQVKEKYSTQIKKANLWETFFDFGFKAFVWICLLVYFILALGEYTTVLGGIQALSYLFQDTLWVIHFIFFLIVIYKGRILWVRKNAQIKVVN